MSSRDALTAVRRFGLGAKPGDLKRISGDPRGYLLAALAEPGAALMTHPDLQASHVVFAAAQEAQRAQRLAKAQMKEDAGSAAPADAVVEKPNPEKPVVPDMGETATMQAPPAGSAEPPVRPKEIRRDALQQEAAARLERAVSTDRPLLERLVMFWSNHFCVSAAKGAVRGMAGAYEREAIRPHVLGRFADMLTAVEQHPAMLIYLDNAQSVGPNSPAGRNRGRGLNENLAREVLELHTLGVDGGYTQDDVTNLARILTGWTVGMVNQERAEPGKFFFAKNRHEPGAWTVLGRRYQDDGRASGEKVLADLARHPATARHIALRLARHFVADEAPPALVARLAKTFRGTDGDLAAVCRALVTSSEAWTAPVKKAVPPYDFVVALMRGFALEPKPGEALRLARALGQPLWHPPAPKGWPDGDDAWLGPSAVRERLRIAERAARMVDRLADPRVVAEDLLGDGMSDATRQAIARAETREQGFELLIMSPEFQRR